MAVSVSFGRTLAATRGTPVEKHYFVFSLHVAALLSAFLCLRMNVQIPWLPYSMHAPVLEK